MTDWGEKYEEDSKKRWPSLQVEHDVPYGWIQWKGTDVCIDIWCKCGAVMHFDGSFMYYVQCLYCHQIWEMDGHIQMHPMSFDPGNVVQLDEYDEGYE